MVLESSHVGFMEDNVAVFFNQHVALDFGLGYAAATLTFDEDSKYKIKTGGVVFSAGISVYL